MHVGDPVSIVPADDDDNAMPAAKPAAIRNPQNNEISNLLEEPVWTWFIPNPSR